ncbi:MAG: TIGR04282 family arsenosugar biosynthesis glycosyltransferase [Planctomycetota bacterium]|nr:TIGR04282 family arsenosugar biosynthesis glycosyltransferase [Planctomycetota bacterium]
MDCFGIFAKYWEPSRVKTRLAATLGSESASEIYRHFVSTLVERFRRCADSRVLCFTPEERAAAFGKLAGADWVVKPQSPGDLGTRMTSFFDSCFQNGAERVVLIGSDSPTIPAAHVESAFRLLHETDVVLGPTDDGGYYLVGASRDVAGIFAEIDWSTPRVWQQTVARLGELRLSYETLPQWYDVDELTDLERLRDELSLLPNDEPAWGELLAAINRVL